jgi:hypothetical protein
MEKDLFVDARTGKPKRLSYRGVVGACITVVFIVECLMRFSMGRTAMIINTDPAFEPPLLLAVGASEWQSLVVSAVSSDRVQLDGDGFIVVDGMLGWYELAFRATLPGLVNFKLTYVSLNSRAVRLSLNDVVVVPEVCSATTKGWEPHDAISFELQTPVWAWKGTNLLRVDTDSAGYFPHVQAVAMRAVSGTRPDRTPEPP